MWNYGEIKLDDGVYDYGLTRASGMVLEHRYVASKLLGRNLKVGEVVHHIDCNRRNNLPDNLLVFCSVSSHTAYHRGNHNLELLNDGSYSVIKSIRVCPICGEITTNKKFCSVKCQTFSLRRVTRPSKEQLQADMLNLSWLALGRKYRVSDNAVRKWARGYSLL